MPPTVYHRDDRNIDFTWIDEGLVRVTAHSAAGKGLERLLKWTDALTAFDPEWQTFGASLIAEHPVVSWENDRLSRIVLRFGDAALARPAWEDALLPLLSARGSAEAVVRASTVPPRDGAAGWTLPLRVVHGSNAPGAVRTAVANTFGSNPPHLIDAAFRVLEADIARWAPSREWPTAEILHFDRWPDVDPALMMRTALRDRPGTLGWITRLTDAAQTRLVIVHAEPHAMNALRELGAALCDRGGPAWMILGEPPGSNAVNWFYDAFIHDRPIDWIARGLRQASFACVCYGGAGREDAIRVSGPIARIHTLAREAMHAQATAKLDIEIEQPRPRGTRRRSATRGPGGAPAAAVRSELERLDQQWDSMEFDFHEGEGLIPSADAVENLRAAAYGPEAPAAEPQVRGVADPATQPRERYVNLGLHADRDLDAAPIPQHRTLRIGQRCRLRIGVGARDESITTLGLRAILDEQLRLRPEHRGAWVEIGVTGIGFDVEGSPVQELWIPAGADSEHVQFSVVPRRQPVSLLRICLYHDQNLIQSFRLAAITEDEPVIDADESRRRLARALDVDIEQVHEAGWLSRMEYSRVVSPDRFATRAPRTLSLATNDVGGLTVITAKGEEQFEVRFPGDLSSRVAQVRQQLKGAATTLIDGVPEDQLPYAFRDQGRPNYGSEAIFKDAIQRLAAAGYNLYSQVVPRQTREQAELQQLDRVIQVANMRPDRVVPWSFLYEFPFEPEGAFNAADEWEAPDTCLAALPNEKGELPVTSCGGPGCLLHSRMRKTVACPLGFWGFRHVIEIPPQQTRGGGSEEADRIEAARPAALFAALNSSLKSHQMHRQKLDAIAVATNGGAQWRVIETSGHRVVELLDDPELDLIYLYCHARGGVVDPGVSEPHLEFVGPGGRPIRITAASLANGTPWEHRPLLILNGCGTVGFSPDALSPFLPILVEDRRAAGLIGTEISVYEDLADEVASTFLEHFLAGETAGRALLIARRKLLAWMNPLGLSYTLYANADLRITRPAGRE